MNNNIYWGSIIKSANRLGKSRQMDKGALIATLAYIYIINILGEKP